MGLLEDLGIRRKDLRTRTTPKTFGELRFEEWLYILDISPEGEDGAKQRARALSEIQFQEGKGFQTMAGSDCQEDSLSPAVRKRLNGFVRVNFYADNAGGKSRATAAGNEIRKEYEGELFVNVRRVYCKDQRVWGWSVWVKPTGTKERLREYWVDDDGKMIKKRGTEDRTVIAPRSKKAGGFAEATSREWGQYRGAAKKKVSCPKCDAPKNYPCVNDKGIKEGIYINEKGKPMTEKEANQYKEGRGLSITVRSKRTNPHRERVTKFLEKKKGLVEVPRGITGETGVFEEKVERRPPTDKEKERYLLTKFNDAQFERFEELEDAGDYSIQDLESIMNKKQVPKYEVWVKRGVEVKDNGEV